MTKEDMGSMGYFSMTLMGLLELESSIAHSFELYRKDQSGFLNFFFCVPQFYRFGTT